MEVKTSFVIPEDLYRELKKRALEEGRSMKDVLIDALLNYLSSDTSGGRKRKELVDLILRPVEGAGPDDLREYEYEDLGD